MEVSYDDQHFDLVAECKKGNRKAQYEIYKLFSKRMFNIAMRIVNNEDEAADVLQESFIHAFSRLCDFRHESSFGWWIKQIVVNKSISHLRKKRVTLLSIDEEHLEDIAEEEDIDHEELTYQVSQVKQAMQLLPENQRVVLSLFLLEGYDHEEIGHILKITENNSRSQVLRAKRKLIEILKKNGFNIK